MLILKLENILADHTAYGKLLEDNEVSRLSV